MDITPISPICNLRVCANVPLDSTYTDTILFGSASAQLAYFVGKTKYNVQNMTPIKLNNKIRIPYDAEKIYSCNYVCFQNTNFGSKWFYAFIKEITWVNVGVCEITIELDVWQTWMFDITIGECYVVREHSVSDNYGEHTLLEPMSVSEYVDEASFKSGHLDSYMLMAQYAKESGGGGVQGGLYSGLDYIHVPLTSSGAMSDFLEGMVNTGKADQVVATYVMPAEFYTTGETCVEIEVTCPKAITSLGDYTPRNKKLLCYPYNSLNVSNSMGQINEYRYEYFYNLGSAALFRMACSMGTSPEVILWPLSYNGKAENFQETMSITGFPQFAFVIDTYRAWVAQNGNSATMQQLSSLVGIGIAAGGAVAAPALSAGSIGAISSGALNLASSMVALEEKSRRPNTSQGSQGSNTMCAIFAKDFYFYQHHIREDYAKIIDDYFDRYGYLTNRLKVPNLNSRPSWNYVECQESVVTGNVPLMDINVIKQTLNQGITFWHGDYVGNYSRSNAPGSVD